MNAETQRRKDAKTQRRKEEKCKTLFRMQAFKRLFRFLCVFASLRSFSFFGATGDLITSEYYAKIAEYK